MSLEKLFTFSKLVTAFGKVERLPYVAGLDRRENDVEHSYQLAMLAWYIAATKNLKLDTTKILKYALVHDLVEVYAGDTWVYSKDLEHLASKHDREAAAASQLAVEIPEFPDLHELIQHYERREDDESRLVYALDKILPILNIYEDGGRTWKEHGITIDMLIEKKKDKVVLFSEIEVYFNELIELLKSEEKELFG